ncbi:hypothetical protein ACB092_09G167500 [Castanea dentata]
MELVKSELVDLRNGKEIDDSKTLYSRLDDHNVSDDDIEEMVAHNDVGEDDDDEPPLNENDDDDFDDVDQVEEQNTQHLVLAQFDKVTRTKSRWKCTLKDGIMHINNKDILFNKEALDGIEFARGDPNSTWGSIRAAMGHPEPFDLRYVAIGNEDCGKKNYRGNYLVFHSAITQAYRDIKMITNCDGSSQQLDHPAGFYDFHIYTSANDLYSKAHRFDHTSRNSPKVYTRLIWAI